MDVKTHTELRKRGKPTWNCLKSEVGNHQEEGEARKLLVGRDRQSKFTFCHLVKCKGTGDERIVKKVLQSIRETGNTKMVLKTDGELATVQLQEQIITEREHKTGSCTQELSREVKRASWGLIFYDSSNKAIARYFVAIPSYLRQSNVSGEFAGLALALEVAPRDTSLAEDCKAVDHVWHLPLQKQLVSFAHRGADRRHSSSSVLCSRSSPKTSDVFFVWNAFLSGLSSRSLTFFLVVALGRVRPHLLMLQMRILLGCSHFSPN